jgi:hypothetical protein
MMNAETKGVDGVIGLDPLASTWHIIVISLFDILGKNASKVPLELRSLQQTFFEVVI